jgi:hypothetical protein
MKRRAFVMDARFFLADGRRRVCFLNTIFQGGSPKALAMNHKGHKEHKKMPVSEMHLLFAFYFNIKPFPNT